MATSTQLPNCSIFPRFSHMSSHTFWAAGASKAQETSTKQRKDVSFYQVSITLFVFVSKSKVKVGGKESCFIGAT